MKLRNPFARAQSDRERIIRLFAIFIGAGYAIYFGLLYVLLEDEARHLDPWWMPLGLSLVYGPPVALFGAAFLADLQDLEKIASAVAFCYLVAAFTWPLAWQGEQLADWPFVARIPALPAMSAALAWKPRWVVLYILVVVAEVQWLGQTRVPATLEPLFLNWLFSASFCLIYVAATLRAARTGRILDEERDKATSVGIQAAEVLAYNEDRENFANIVHDDVLHCLRYGDQPGFDPKYAVEAIENLDKIGNATGDEPFSARDVISYLRSKLERIDDEVAFNVESTAETAADPFAADLVRTVGIGLVEAIRNSIAHNELDTTRSVTLRIGPDRLAVVVTDDGAGFDLWKINQRWGLQRMRRQMEQIPGGAFLINAPKGHGTTIEMQWTNEVPPERRTRGLRALGGSCSE